MPMFVEQVRRRAAMSATRLVFSIRENADRVDAQSVTEVCESVFCQQQYSERISLVTIQVVGEVRSMRLPSGRL